MFYWWWQLNDHMKMLVICHNTTHLKPKHSHTFAVHCVRLSFSGYSTNSDHTNTNIHVYARTHCSYVVYINCAATLLLILLYPTICSNYNLLKCQINCSESTQMARVGEIDSVLVEIPNTSREKWRASVCVCECFKYDRFSCVHCTLSACSSRMYVCVCLCHTRIHLYALPLYEIALDKSVHFMKRNDTQNMNTK